MLKDKEQIRYMAEREAYEREINRLKSSLAEELKCGMGEEMKKTLSEKKNEKKSIFKGLFNKFKKSQLYPPKGGCLSKG